MLCPCGSEQAFNQCCEKIITGNSNANSPEQLMRSRYSAYATNQAEYIFHTYADISRKTQTIDDIAQWANETKWLKLVIHHASNFQHDLLENNSAQVGFSAYYSHQDQIFHMRENSNFIMEHNQWRYLDGDVSESSTIDKPTRNQHCFCGSTRKFKQCCAKAF
ncbi:YchJ family protein [Cognaticolwellia mytili]|uniref:YchJ family protein n=1 Tax=Cognaticolwellia mytili TaxID=1888913 RepID=UPI000A176091|nr:YchJ family metal-binding protein [Cognaticolwellia mytili]